MYYVWLSVAKGENLLVASLSEKGLTLTISTASLSHVT